MRKPILFLGVGFLALASLFFYAEHNRRETQEMEAQKAIEEVLRAQNQSLAAQLADSFSRVDRDALGAFLRKKKAAGFVTDTALAEPQAPKWIIVGEQKLRAAGVVDDALLEDALAKHLLGNKKLALYPTKGKYFLFVKGSVNGEVYAAAYAPEVFFSAFRASGGIRTWLVLKDGTVIYHPNFRFIGSNSANLKPVAAGIRGLNANDGSLFVRSYLSLEGNQTVGAWTPLPILDLLVGSEWVDMPAASATSLFFWLAVGGAILGALALGWALNFRLQPREVKAFDESRLDQDAMDYLEGARHTAEQALALAEERQQQLDAMLSEKREDSERQGEMEWRIAVLQEFQEKILPKVTGKQVWSELCQLITSRSPGLSAVFYRYSPSSFSLVPETLHGKQELPESAQAYFRDARIFIGNPSFLPRLLETEAFQQWNAKRERHMPLHQTDFRAFAIQCAGVRGAILLYFDRRMNAQGEMENALDLSLYLAERTATFCDSLGHLLQSLYAKGSAWHMASSANHAGNRSQPT